MDTKEINIGYPKMILTGKKHGLKVLEAIKVLQIAAWHKQLEDDHACYACQN